MKPPTRSPRGSRGTAKSHTQSVYVTIRHHLTNGEPGGLQFTVTIPESTFMEVYEQLLPALDELHGRGQKRLARLRGRFLRVIK